MLFGGVPVVIAVRPLAPIGEESIQLAAAAVVVAHVPQFLRPHALAAATRHDVERTGGSHDGADIAVERLGIFHMAQFVQVDVRRRLVNARRALRTVARIGRDGPDVQRVGLQGQHFVAARPGDP